MLGQNSNPTLQSGVAEQEPYFENASSKWQRRHSWSITAIANAFPETEKTIEPKQDRSAVVLLPFSALIHQPLLLECKRGFLEQSFHLGFAASFEMRPRSSSPFAPHPCTPSGMFGRNCS